MIKNALVLKKMKNTFWFVLLILLQSHSDSMRPHDEKQQGGVEERQKSEQHKRHAATRVLVQDAAERWRYETAERDERERDTERFRSLALFGESVGDHGQAARVCERAAHALQTACDEKYRV